MQQKRVKEGAGKSEGDGDVHVVFAEEESKTEAEQSSSAEAVKSRSQWTKWKCGKGYKAVISAFEDRREPTTVPSREREGH